MRTLYRCSRSLIVVAVVLFLSASTSEGATISFAVTPQSAPGANLEIAVQIAGLGAGTSPSVGTFDLDVNFDAAMLAPIGVIFGDPILGDQLDFSGFGIKASFEGSGFVNLFELSLDTEAELNALQASTFTLATLTFQPLATGSSLLTTTLFALGDAVGDPLGAQLIDSNVDVTVVPEPTSLILVGTGAVSLLIARRRGRHR